MAQGEKSEDPVLIKTWMSVPNVMAAPRTLQLLRRFTKNSPQPHGALVRGSSTLVRFGY